MKFSKKDLFIYLFDAQTFEKINAQVIENEFEKQLEKIKKMKIPHDGAFRET